MTSCNARLGFQAKLQRVDCLNLVIRITPTPRNRGFSHRLFQRRQRDRVDNCLIVMEEAASKRPRRQEHRQDGDHTHYLPPLTQ
jgi:hypothetical protein